MWNGYTINPKSWKAYRYYEFVALKFQFVDDADSDQNIVYRITYK